MTKVCYKGKPAIIIDDRYKGKEDGYEILIEIGTERLWIDEDDPNLEELAIIRDKGPTMLEFYGDY